MAAFGFCQIYRGIKEELGEDMVLKLFPEYSTLPKKMSPNEQVRLSKIIMDRMDELLDKDIIAKVRHKHCCNITKNHIEEIKNLKKHNNNIDEIFTEYSKFLKFFILFTHNIYEKSLHFVNSAAFTLCSKGIETLIITIA